MNLYLISLIGLVAAMAVGFVTYGLLFKGFMDGHAPKPAILVVNIVTMYIVCTGFFSFYRLLDKHGVSAGLAMGILAAGFFALPLAVDQDWLRTDARRVRIVAATWAGSFVAMGLIAGLLG